MNRFRDATFYVTMTNERENFLCGRRECPNERSVYETSAMCGTFGCALYAICCSRLSFLFDSMMYTWAQMFSGWRPDTSRINNVEPNSILSATNMPFIRLKPFVSIMRSPRNISDGRKSIWAHSLSSDASVFALVDTIPFGVDPSVGTPRLPMHFELPRIFWILKGKETGRVQ